MANWLAIHELAAIESEAKATSRAIQGTRSILSCFGGDGGTAPSLKKKKSPASLLSDLHVTVRVDSGYLLANAGSTLILRFVFFLL